MKAAWTILFVLLGTQFTYANTEIPKELFDEGLPHVAIADRLVVEGDVLIQTRDLPRNESGEDFFQTRIRYNFVIETLFSRKVRKGEERFDLPQNFRTEIGYQNLEVQNVYEDDRIKMIHQGRKDWESFYDCHFVKIIPKYKDTWDGQFFYCSGAPKSGIVELRFRVKNIPFLGEHTITSRWITKQVKD